MAKNNKLNSTSQKELFSSKNRKAQVDAAQPISDFVCPQENDIYLNDTPIVSYLNGSGLGWLISFSKFIFSLDLSEFKKNYKIRGRRPIHPAITLSLILYGIIRGEFSLRGLEQLSKRDIGAMYLCRGLQPDHSTIGDFLSRHRHILNKDFLSQNIEKIVTKASIDTSLSAIDGSVFEASASRFNLLMKEAVEAKAKELSEKAKKEPDNEKLQKKAVKYSEAVEAVNKRVKDACLPPGEAKKLKVNLNEPEAALQKLKNGAGYRSGYKMIISATSGRFITGVEVHSTNEASAVETLLEQHENGCGKAPDTALLDAGFFTGGVLKVAMEREQNVLIPEGKADMGKYESKKVEKEFDKHNFKYDEELDIYKCPEGKELHPAGRGSSRGMKYMRYRCKECADCKYFGRCTKSVAGRVVNRFEGDELKEAMREVMKQKKAREVYKRRKEIVEPVFSVFRGVFGFSRFKRNGLEKVFMEAVLLTVAYNLKLAFETSGVGKYAFQLIATDDFLIIFALAVKYKPQNFKIT